MCTLKQQVLNQRYWKKFTISEESYGLVRGSILKGKLGTQYKYVRILGSVIWDDEGTKRPVYLMKHDEKRIPELNSKCEIRYLSLDEVKKYQTSIKEVLKNL